MTLIGMMLIIVGLAGLVAALRPARRLYNISGNQHKGWGFLLSLITLFIAGYLSYLWVLINIDAGLFEIVVASIFFGGGVFVFVVVIMILKKILLLQKTIQDKDHQANHDYLTGLPNRYPFYHKIDKLISLSDQKFCCLMLDLDKFKIINDTFGHADGDHVLQVLGQRLIESIPKKALAARLGGDEFSVILPNTQSQDALTVARSIRHELSQVIHIGSCSLIVDVSIGISEYPRDGDSRQSLMKNADIAMFRSKKQGNHFQMFF
jgi:diguanylate cyclase (GGDEF)-like protein